LWRSSTGEILEILTKRELDVLRLMAGGESKAEIAVALRISLGTVKWHAVNLLGKLAVRNRTQAVRRGRELGLI